MALSPARVSWPSRWLRRGFSTQAAYAEPQSVGLLGCGRILGIFGQHGGSMSDLHTAASVCLAAESRRLSSYEALGGRNALSIVRQCSEMHVEKLRAPKNAYRMHSKHPTRTWFSAKYLDCRRYDKLLLAGTIREDDRQKHCVARLDELSKMCATGPGSFERLVCVGSDSLKTVTECELPDSVHEEANARWTNFADPNVGFCASQA